MSKPFPLKVSAGAIAFAIVALGSFGAKAQQFIVIPATVQIEVFEGREIAGGAAGRPKRAEWYTSDPQVVELSYPIYLHYRAPAPGTPHISHVIWAECKSPGRGIVEAIPIDPNLMTAKAEVTCVEKQKVEPLVPRNIEDCSGAPEGDVLKWKTPISDANFPNCGGAVTCSAVAGKTLCAAINSFVSIRIDNKVCSECHHRNSGSTYSPDVGPNSTGGVAKDDFAPTYADAFLTKSNPASPAYKDAYLRNLIKKWKDDGYH